MGQSQVEVEQGDDVEQAANATWNTMYEHPETVNNNCAKEPPAISASATDAIQNMMKTEQGDDGGAFSGILHESQEELQLRGSKAYFETVVGQPCPDTIPDLDQIDLNYYVRIAIGFSIALLPCVSVEVSANPDGGFNRVAIPIIGFYKQWVKDCWGKWREGDTMPDVETFVQALQVIVYAFALDVGDMSMTEAISLKTMHHKLDLRVEANERENLIWFTKCCQSARNASVLFQ